MVIKGAVIILMAQYGIKMINGRPRTPRTQGLVKQANGIMKDKLSKRIEATGNPNWSEHLVRVALAILFLYFHLFDLKILMVKQLYLVI